MRSLPRYQLCAISQKRGLHGIADAKLTNIVQTTNPDEAAEVRAFVDQEGLLAKPVRQIDFLPYRFQVDIDGNSNSWSFLLKLLMGSCVLKVTSRWRQWYYDDLRPWEHYVPVQEDLSDFEEKVNWCLDNDDNAREIGANGLKFASGIVFGTQMQKAAGVVLRASRNAL